MYTKPTTLTEFILQEERKVKHATGSFTLLLTHIENAAKIIASHIRKTGLLDIIAATGEKNVSADDLIKIDKFSNDLLIEILANSGQVYAAASEETEKPIIMDKKNGKYIVFFDPIDGSSNVASNDSVGTIFSVYRRSDSIIKSGKEQVAAGYILYGPSVLFVYTFGNGVNGFTLDSSIGNFLLSHANMKIPKKGKTYSINEGNSLFWEESTNVYLEQFKNNESVKSRYAGCIVADVHRILVKGGIFLYPVDKQHPNGKVRLMYEANPMSYIVIQAGGKSVSDGKNALDIIPSSFHQRVPIVLGSPQDVDKYLSFCG